MEDFMEEKGVENSNFTLAAEIHFGLISIEMAMLHSQEKMGSKMVADSFVLFIHVFLAPGTILGIEYVLLSTVTFLCLLPRPKDRRISVTLD